MYKNFLFAIFCFLVHQPLFAQPKVAVTFRVNLQNEWLSADGVHLIGNFQNWNLEATPMQQVIGTTIWEKTVDLPANGIFQYQFVNGKTSNTIENINDTTCTLSKKRLLLTQSQAISLSPVCFGSCSDCAISDTTLCNVTISVDMCTSFNSMVDTAGVHIAGTFQGWDPAKTKMTADSTNFIWTTTVKMRKKVVNEYKFINGKQWGQEEYFKGFCTNGINSNRVITVTKDTILPMCYFESCQKIWDLPPCFTSEKNVAFDTFFQLFPNPSNEQMTLNYHFLTPNKLSIRLLNLLGKEIFYQKEENQSEGTIRINTQNLNNGVYLLELNNGVNQTAKKVIIQH
jgi:Secretion system C-terminal sorting domain